jgi:hypothetical protein
VSTSEEPGYGQLSDGWRSAQARVEEASPQRAQVLRLRFADYRARRGV